MIQRLIRTGLIIRVRVIRVWWEVVRVAVWLMDTGDVLGTGAGVVEGVFSTSALRAGKEADVGRLDIGKYLSSKSALSEMTTVRSSQSLLEFTVSCTLYFLV